MGTLVAAAEELVPRIRDAADEIDDRRELPGDLVDALGDAGLFWGLVPRSLGGSEVDLPTWLRVVEVVSAADGSTGWCVNQGAVFATITRYLDRDVACEIWSEPRDVVANGPPPGGEAKEVEGGYRLSGRWTFSSGCRHATWLGAIASVGGDTRILLLPKSSAEIVDVWNVRGLRGTGSHHFAVDDLFVPATRAVSLRDPVLEAGPLYAISMNLLFACGFGSVALGIARAALDSALELCRVKTPRFSRRATRDESYVHVELGRAEATWGAAHAFLHDTARDVWSAVEASREISIEERVRLRMASTHAIREAVRVGDAAYDLAGTDALYVPHPVQRRFQDLHAIAQHLQARRSHYGVVGAFLLGHDPDLLYL